MHLVQILHKNFIWNNIWKNTEYSHAEQLQSHTREEGVQPKLVSVHQHNRQGQWLLHQGGWTLKNPVINKIQTTYNLRCNWNRQIRRWHYHWHNKFVELFIELFGYEVLKEPCGFIDWITPFASPISHICFCCLSSCLPRISWNECYKKLVPSTLRNLEKWILILNHLVVEARNTSSPSKRSKCQDESWEEIYQAIM